MTLTDEQAVFVLSLAQRMVEERQLPLPSEVLRFKRLLKDASIECMPRTTTHHHSIRAVLSRVKDGSVPYLISGYAQLTPRELTHLDSTRAIELMRKDYSDAHVDQMLNDPGNFLIKHFDLSDINQCREVIDIVRCLHVTATSSNVVFHQPGPSV